MAFRTDQRKNICNIWSCKVVLERRVVFVSSSGRLAGGQVAEAKKRGDEMEVEEI